MKEFHSMTAFAEHLGHLVLQERKILDRVGQIIETAAKDKIGDYQDEAGPFAAWAPLAPSTIEDKEAQGYAPPDNPLLRTGEMRDSIGHTVEGAEVSIGSNDDKAVWQELGTPTMPPRSFLGGAGVEQTEKVVTLIGEAAVLTLIGGDVLNGKMPIGARAA